MTWISENLSSLLVGIGLLLLLTLAVTTTSRSKKSTGGCANCSCCAHMQEQGAQKGACKQSEGMR